QEVDYSEQSEIPDIRNISSNHMIPWQDSHYILKSKNDGVDFSPLSVVSYLVSRIQGSRNRSLT
ncbi:hypothetical protein KL920_005446, partial [Ogataea angusta]